LFSSHQRQRHLSGCCRVGHQLTTVDRYRAVRIGWAEEAPQLPLDPGPRPCNPPPKLPDQKKHSRQGMWVHQLDFSSREMRQKLVCSRCASHLDINKRCVAPCFVAPLQVSVTHVPRWCPRTCMRSPTAGATRALIWCALSALRHSVSVFVAVSKFTCMMHHNTCS
jgi:hypothetical protein